MIQMLKRALGSVCLGVALTALPAALLAAPEREGGGELAPFWAITVSVLTPGIPAEVWEFRYSTVERCDTAVADVQHFFHLDNAPLCQLKFGPAGLVDKLKREESPRQQPELGT